MKPYSFAGLALLVFLSTLVFGSCVFAGADEKTPVGTMQRKLKCSESSGFQVCEGPGTMYPGFSKVIKTEMFGHGVTISYVPVFESEDGEEHLDDGDFEADKTDEGEYKLNTVNVVYNFGFAGVFILPLHIESELATEDTLDAASEFIPFTDFFGDHTLKVLKSSAAATKGSSTERDKREVRLKKWNIFDGFYVLSPFHPYVLAVIRFLINNPAVIEKLQDAVEKIVIDTNDLMQRKTYPVISHDDKNYFNLAAAFPTESQTKKPYPDNLYPKRIYYAGEGLIQECSAIHSGSGEVCRIQGTHTMKYEGDDFIDSTEVKIIQHIDLPAVDSGSSSAKGGGIKYQYGLDIGQIELLPEGIKHLETHVGNVLVMGDVHAEISEKADDSEQSESDYESGYGRRSSVPDRNYSSYYPSFHSIISKQENDGYYAHSSSYSRKSPLTVNDELKVLTGRAKKKVEQWRSEFFSADRKGDRFQPRPILNVIVGEQELLYPRVTSISKQ